jgi:hypothetical protein
VRTYPLPPPPPVNTQVFATILAMITDEINSVMLAARSGKAPLALSGHILILNWNAQVRVGVFVCLCVCVFVCGVCVCVCVCWGGGG